MIESPLSATTMYGINELNGEINRYNVKADGSLELAKFYSSNPNTKFESSHTNAAIVATKDGFVFASIRVY